MDAFTRHDLEKLAKHSGAWCVSVYLPTDRTANGMLQNPIRLKNLATWAEKMLLDHGARAAEARKLLEPLDDLLEQKPFWKGVSDGAVVFLETDNVQTYRLPQRFAEMVIVGKRFHIKPLVPLTVGDGRFLLLALSGNVVRMYEGDRWGLRALDVPSLPKNRTDALHYDKPEEVRQAHTATTGGRYGTQMSFHGQGGGVDAAQDETLEFLHIVERALAKRLTGEQAPLVFAGVEHLFPLFKKVCSYPYLLAEHIKANTDAWNEDQLLAAAWIVVEPLFNKTRDDAVDRGRAAAGTDYSLLQLDRVLRACQQGQVETLLVDPSQSRWGTYDPRAGTVHLDGESKPGNEDLLDLAVSLTLQNRGNVFPADSRELPDRSSVAALLRYRSTATPIPEFLGAAKVT